ncbi:MAG TPA: HD domain-containing protein [Eubacteriales bacterium]|nr:HD domain-containing protein [Eubacteriales bacterium]
MSRMRLLNESKGQSFEGFCLVKTVAVKTNVKGSEYLDLVLADCEGDCAAKLWDYSKELHGVFAPDDIIKVRGSINIWKDTEQLKIDKIRHATPEDSVDMALLLPCSPFDPEWLYDQLFELAESFEDDDLRRLVQYFLREKKEKLLFFPAAVKLHHATRGGLLHHTWTITQLAKSVVTIYPALDPDLIYAGAILHDIGKLEELDTGELGIAGGYTTRGQLVGHISIGISEVSAACEMLGVPEETGMLIEHMLLAHHGQAEFGSPKQPMFPEAEVLAELDLLDSKMYEMFSALDGVSVGAFSERQWALDNRQLYRHGHGHIKKGESK